MTAIAGDLTKKILGHSDADKAFRPWWDNLEDGVLYSFVVMGRCVTLCLCTIAICDAIKHNNLYEINVIKYKTEFHNIYIEKKPSV